MKLDYMVYGRGQEQTAGFALQAAPAYVRQELLLNLSEFLEMGDERLQAEFPPEIAEHPDDPWADTWLFVCQPPPSCCALVRMIRAEGDAPGEYLREVRGKTVWSLEGWCAPFELREQFFALIPSILLQMREEPGSLYNRSRRREIAQQSDLPDRLVYNPYGEMPPPASPGPAWDALCRSIRYTPQPFPFLYGPLAAYYAQKIGRQYHVSHVFPSAGTLTFPEPAGDALASMEYAALRETAGQRHIYQLRLHSDRREVMRRWGLCENDKHYQEDAFTGAPQPADSEEGILMAELLAESELIRDFANRMGWQTYPQTAPVNQRYQYIKEE